MLNAEAKEKVKSPEVSVITRMLENNHEQVMFCNDQDTGLKAIIAIHNTILGPALGGTRFWDYATETDALNDVLRLSRGMTYKAAAAGLNLGGGKAVIIGNPVKIKNEALLRRFGKFVNNLGGKYITAEDIAMNSRDMEYIHMETKHVTGIPELSGGSGDPSIVTAYGVYLSMKASAKEQWGNESLEGKKIAVQGVGHVGECLVRYLIKEGAKVVIADINPERVRTVASELGAEAVESEKIMDIDMDIYAPCALGATVNEATLGRLKCSIICGSANNQLADEKVHGEELSKKGILYAPDFLVNAGGLINVYNELLGYNRERAMKQAETIYENVTKVFRISKADHIPTYLAANRVAEQRITALGKVKLSHC
jgi:leucine dehydrogenase